MPQQGKPASKSVDSCYTRILIQERNPPLRQSLPMCVGALFSLHYLHKAVFILKRFAACGWERTNRNMYATHIHSYTLTLFIKQFQSKNTCMWARDWFKSAAKRRGIQKKSNFNNACPITSIYFCSRSIKLQIPENTVKYTVACHATQVSWSAWHTTMSLYMVTVLLESFLLTVSRWLLY